MAAYDGPLREALVAFKDHGRWLLRRPLGRALARAVAAGLADLADPPGRVLLVPVPGSPGSARLRDGDHVGELARVAARSLDATTGVPTRVVSALAPARRRRDQVGLDRGARAANLSGSMVALPSRLPATARRGGAGTEVLVVVDDLTTTGATLAEAVRALRRAGAGEVLAAVVAAREIAGVPRSP